MVVGPVVGGLAVGGPAVGDLDVARSFLSADFSSIKQSVLL